MGTSPLSRTGTLNAGGGWVIPRLLAVKVPPDESGICTLFCVGYGEVRAELNTAFTGFTGSGFPRAGKNRLEIVGSRKRVCKCLTGKGLETTQSQPIRAYVVRVMSALRLLKVQVVTTHTRVRSEST